MRARAVCPAGSWDVAVGTVLIDYDRRHRRRLLLSTTDGRDLMLDLPQATHLRDGCGLVLDGGGIVEVRAQPEALLEVTADSAELLLRIAWHLGNRHLPMQIARNAAATPHPSPLPRERESVAPPPLPAAGEGRGEGGAAGDPVLLVREDHVIAAMLAGLGGQVRTVLAPFDPEAGAYADSHEH